MPTKAKPFWSAAKRKRLARALFSLSKHDREDFLCVVINKAWDAPGEGDKVRALLIAQTTEELRDDAEPEPESGSIRPSQGG